MKQKYRLLLVTKGKSPNESYTKYQEDMKKTFSIQSQKERNIKRKSISGDIFSVKLYGYDSKLKQKWLYWPGWSAINTIVDKMPQRKKELKQKITNYSLYSDDHPSTTLKGIGFKNKEVAKQSIRILMNSKLTDTQKLRIANVMIQRALHHPHLNNDMKQAVKIYQTYLSQTRL